MYLCNGNGVDRTSRVPKSVLHLIVDKGQDLRSGILKLKGMTTASLKLQVGTMLLDVHDHL